MMNLFVNRLSMSIRSIISFMVIALSGCHDEKTIPADFFIKLESRPVQPLSSWYELRIERIEHADTFPRFQVVETDGRYSVKRKLEDQTIRAIMAAIQNAEIFRLKDEYKDMRVHDGSSETLTITMNSKTKIIRLRNLRPAELKNFIELLHRSAR